MSVMKELQTNQAKSIKWTELNERERNVVQHFRMLDEVSKKDLIRFINVLLRLK